MRLLGARTGMTVFRWDLTYLCARLDADGRAEVAALAATVGALLGRLRDEREAFELTEDAAIVARARRVRRGMKLDRALIAMGGVARASDRALYATLFSRRNPSKTARLAPREKLQEVARMLGELDVRPAGHPVRAAYQARLAAAQVALRAALEAEANAETQLALARMQRARLKRSLDEARLVVHGQLLALLRDKAEASAFFRPTTKRPGSEPEKRTQEAAAPATSAAAEKASSGKRTEKASPEKRAETETETETERAEGAAETQAESAAETQAESAAETQVESAAQARAESAAETQAESAAQARAGGEARGQREAADPHGREPGALLEATGVRPEAATHAGALGWSAGWWSPTRFTWWGGGGACSCRVNQGFAAGVTGVPGFTDVGAWARGRNALLRVEATRY